MEYENWGCEFIEGLSSRGEPPVRMLSDALWLPVSVLLSAADPKYLKDSRRLRRGRIEGLKHKILEEGIKEPGLLLIGRNQVYFKDGNHRLLGCLEMGWEWFPVTLKYEEAQIKIRTITTGEFIQQIVPLIAEKRYRSQS